MNTILDHVFENKRFFDFNFFGDLDKNFLALMKI